MCAPDLPRCDCLNNCGDDPAVQCGKAKPCDHLQARLDRPKFVELRRLRGSQNSAVITFDKPLTQEDLDRVKGAVRGLDVRLLGF